MKKSFDDFLAEKIVDCIQDDGRVEEVLYPEFAKRTMERIANLRGWRAREKTHDIWGLTHTSNLGGTWGSYTETDAREAIRQYREEALRLEEELKSFVKAARKEYDALPAD